MEKNIYFPDGFLWGAATSAYQYEGASEENGKKKSLMDVNINRKFASTKVTSDHYHHWSEDVDLMKELGIKSYRFSIAWARIIPDGHGKVNLLGVKFYNDLIDKLIENQIEPIITIYHFDLPLKLQEEYGGWQSRKIIKDFQHYCYVLFSNFGDRVKYWLTINEQSNMFVLPYLLKYKNKTLDEKTKFQMNHHMMLANAVAINLAHKMLSDVKIGPAIGLSPFYPVSSKPSDVLAAQNAASFRNYFFLDLYFYGSYRKDILNYLSENNLMPQIYPNDQELLKKAHPDILGINYYESKTVAAYKQIGENIYKEPVVNDDENDNREGEARPGLYKEVTNKNLPVNKWKWSIDPEGFRILLRDIYDRYQVPIIITENGIGGTEKMTTDKKIHDQYRIEFLQMHLKQLSLTIHDGVDIIGYQPWAFMDLLSTTNGFKKRYGFVFVNRTDDQLLDMKRYKKDSFFWYQEIIRTNGRSLLNKY